MTASTSRPRPSRSARLLAGVRSSLHNRLLLATLLVSLVPMVVLATAIYLVASRALVEEAEARLQALRTIKAQQVENYFGRIHEQVRTLSHNLMVVEAVEQFAAAEAKVVEQAGVDAEQAERLREELRSYYVTEYANEFLAHVGRQPKLDARLGPLDASTVWLQHQYLRSNPNPLGSKQQYNGDDDGTDYSRLHRRYHPVMRNYAEQFGFYDVFLADLKSGKIVYSVFKEVDFGTSLRDGPYANTAMGRVFRQAAAASWRDEVAFADYAPYPATYEDPASFVASPIFDGDRKVGVLIFQLPIDRINAIMAERTGLGLTGEAIAVGPDKLLRSQPLFGSRKALEKAVINPEMRIDTVATREALEGGHTGIGPIDDYRGEPVVAAWTPITVHDADGRPPVRWAVISKIDRDELNEPAWQMAWFAGTIFLAAAVAVFLVSYSVARRFEQASRRQANLIDAVTENTHAMASASEELTSVSQQMSSNAEQTGAQANVVSAAAEQVSANAQTVTAGVDNITASVREIAQSAHEAAQVAQRSVGVAGEASRTIHQLGESSSEIGAVVQAITSVAEQTNLLALNATIEAARAGDAGKGFAVVANEVKELARETARATEDIRRKIDAIQADSDRAVEAIGEIGAIINQISDLQNTIASAVEEQTATTAEISRNVSEAAQGSSEIARNITQVADAAASTAEGAGNTQQAAQELAHMASTLQALIEDYRNAEV